MMQKKTDTYKWR